MKFKVGDKVKFKDFNQIQKLYNKSTVNISSLNYVEAFIKESKILTVRSIFQRKIHIAESSFWKGRFNVAYYYPIEWFEPILKDKIDKLLKL